MSCDLVRDQLAEYLLGSLDPEEDTSIRRHLRGCASCRRELAAMEEGLATFASAAHQADPPEGLRDRVLEVLQEDRPEPSEASVARKRGGTWWLKAAAIAVLVGSLAWGAVATVRANTLAGPAGRYQSFLDALGGREVRVATLHATGSQPVDGSAILYDSDVGQSWVVVLARSPGATGETTAVIMSPHGRIALRPTEFSPEGDVATWMVTSADISRYGRVVLLDHNGHAIAAGHVTEAD